MACKITQKWESLPTFTHKRTKLAPPSRYVANESCKRVLDMEVPGGGTWNLNVVGLLCSPNLKELSFLQGRTC
jgi:hypothetical protein